MAGIIFNNVVEKCQYREWKVKITKSITKRKEKVKIWRNKKIVSVKD